MLLYPIEGHFGERLHCFAALQDECIALLDRMNRGFKILHMQKVMVLGAE